MNVPPCIACTPPLTVGGGLANFEKVAFCSAKALRVRQLIRCPVSIMLYQMNLIIYLINEVNHILFDFLKEVELL